MTQPPDDLTQPIPSDATHEQPAVETATPAWANAAREGDGTASAPQVPVARVSPAAPVSPVAATPEKKTWRSRVSGGRGLAVGALVVGLGLGAVGGSAATWAVTHDDGAGTVADGTGRFDRDGDGDSGPHGGRGGPPPGARLPGGGELPGDGQQQNGDSGTDANGTSQAT